MAGFHKENVKLIASASVIFFLGILLGSGCEQRPTSPPAQAPMRKPIPEPSVKSKPSEDLDRSMPQTKPHATPEAASPPAAAAARPVQPGPSQELDRKKSLPKSGITEIRRVPENND